MQRNHFLVFSLLILTNENNNIELRLSTVSEKKILYSLKMLARYLRNFIPLQSRVIKKNIYIYTLRSLQNETKEKRVEGKKIVTYGNTIIYLILFSRNQSVDEVGMENK